MKHRQWYKVSAYFSLGFVGILSMMVMIGAHAAYAGDMSSSLKKALEVSHVPIYPGATFSTSDNRDAYVAIWFDTKDSSEKVMQWYVGKLTDWQHISFKGRPVLYKGPDGLEAMQVFTKPYPYLFTEVRDEGSGQETAITIVVQKQGQ